MFSGGTETGQWHEMGEPNLTKYWHDTLNCVRRQPLRVTSRSAFFCTKNYKSPAF